MPSPLRDRAFAAALACASILLLAPADADAQRRGRAVVRPAPVVIARPAFFGYGLYDPWWSWGPGWGPGWGWGPAWYPPYAWAGRGIASARLQVTPRQAEVFVDGYAAGRVDDFDGVFQRLDLPPGEHELTIYLDGHRPYTVKVLFRPAATVTIRHQLEPLAPGEAASPRPQPVPQPVMAGGPPSGPSAAFGTLAIRVQPADATLLVDGQEWDAPGAQGPIEIELPEGPHEIEVRRDGAESYRRTVVVRGGRTVSLNVSLPR